VNDANNTCFEAVYDMADVVNNDQTISKPKAK
jgi:hypothetical protein